jgi:hypothetical protein
VEREKEYRNETKENVMTKNGKKKERELNGQKLKKHNEETRNTGIRKERNGLKKERIRIEKIRREIKTKEIHFQYQVIPNLTRSFVCTSS